MLAQRCTAVLTAVVCLPLLGVAGASASAAAPASAVAPACGSLDSLQKGNTYSGTIKIKGAKHVQKVRDLKFGAETERQGKVAVGPVTGTVTDKGKQKTMRGQWTSVDGYVTKVFSKYVVTDTARKNKYGSYTCDTDSGAVTDVKAEWIESAITGGQLDSTCDNGSCGVYEVSPAKIVNDSQATLTLTSNAY